MVGKNDYLEVLEDAPLGVFSAHDPGLLESGLRPPAQAASAWCALSAIDPRRRRGLKS
jgi:hypothetical protein